MTNDTTEQGAEALREIRSGKQVRSRSHAEIKWRASGDPDMKDVRILTGYPAVFDQATVLYEDDYCLVRETVAPEFFDDVLADDCHLNYVHESGSAMCRNNPCMAPQFQGGPGSMELSTDNHGLRLFARIPMNDIDAQRMAPKMDNGVVDQMSFAFTVDEEDLLQTTGDDGRTIFDYTLRKCGRLFDVTVCPLGAYSQTEAALRSIAPKLAARSKEGREILDRSLEGLEGEAAPSQEELDAEEAYNRFVADAKARTAQFKFKSIEKE